ncbi:hypothetical protein [Streptomyces buecherae]|uniref:hypothetical protein n=1 Tax=Streptomyces buecherae TaxID=2763006 RepID=UPI0037BC80A5
MKSLKAKRVLVAASMVMGVVAVPIATAAPASASLVPFCVDVIQDAGYKVGPKVRHACQTGVKNQKACEKEFKAIGVNSKTANRACRVAGKRP